MKLSKGRGGVMFRLGQYAESAVGPGQRRAGSADLGTRPQAAALVAGLIIAAVWVIAYTRWAVADMTVPWDAKNQFYAFFRFLAQSLHAGTSIFWNPYHYGGHPSIADPQSLVFAPLFLAWAYLDPAPSMAAFDMVVYAHLLVGGLAFVGLGARRD